MKLFKTTITMTCLLLALAGNGFGSGDKKANELISMLMKNAAAKNIEGLLELRDRAMLSGKTHYAFHLARFIADPKGYADTFISEFPANTVGVMGQIYELELARGRDGQRFTPYFLYSFDQLGKLAIDGNSAAAGKLYDVMIHSDGVVTEFVCERISKVIVDQTTIALGELAKRSADQRKRVYSCFGAASATEISSMKSSLGKQLPGDFVTITREVVEALDKAY